MPTQDDCPGYISSSVDENAIHSALVQIPSAFERLVYIGSLARSQDRGEETASASHREGLRIFHSELFSAWLCLNLEQQLEDLKTYARRQSRPPYELLRRWLQPHCYERLIPPGALQPERELFTTDLETLLQLLTRGES